MGSSVVHHTQDGADFKCGIEILFDLVDIAQQLTEALQGVILTLDRDKNFASGHQGVHGQEPERGRTVNNDEVVLIKFLIDRPLETVLTSHFIHELNFGSSQVKVRWNYEEIFDIGRFDTIANCYII